METQKQWPNFKLRIHVPKRKPFVPSKALKGGGPAWVAAAMAPLSRPPLDIIVEEDEQMSVKARRRQATVSASDLRLSRVFPNNDSSPPASPDSFRLTFTDVSFTFPHPPIPTPSSLRKYHRREQCISPSHSSSSLSSSPASQTEAMPLTPSTSDDELFGPSRRPVIQPLVITKHSPRLFNDDDDACSISPTLLQPFKTPSESLQSSVPLSPLSPSYLLEEFFYQSDDDVSDSEPESDSEWYSKELSKIISLRSPLPSSSFPLQTPARPDSMSITSADIPTSRRRVSKPLPPTPLSGGFPSAQLDPTFSHRRRRTLPKYPPPPVPTISPSPTSSSHSRRPPPRSSIPADCVYDLEDIEDASSIFSFSIYDVYLGGEQLNSPTSLPSSSYSQSSFEDPIDSVTFDLDYSLMLPLSLPTTPLDLEADIAQGLEKLRNSPNDVVQPPVWAAVIDDSQEPEQHQAVVVQPQPQVFNDIFSPLSSPSPLSDRPATPCIDKTLKSKWSTTTLGSIREEHKRGGASAKLRLYFTGNSPSKNNNSKQGSKKISSPVFPRGRKPITSLSSSSSPPPSAGSTRSPSKPSLTHHMRGYSDVMVIGYGNNNNNGMRRRGSVTHSVSDAGSEESCSSTSSSGLRRKPIPVEMFLRSAV